MSVSKEALGWIAAFGAAVVFAVPWVLWRTDAVVAGLPVWLWWHVAAMVLTAVLFREFARRSWGLFVEGGA